MSQKKAWLEHYPESIGKTITIPEIPMGKILQETAAKFPANNALSFYGRKITYEQLNQMAQSFTSALQKNQVQKGDRVAIMLPNCPQYVISYYGILNAGAIVTQVNPMSVERELEYILKDSGAETIIVFDALYPRVKSVQPQTNLKNVIVVRIQPSSQDFSPDRSFESFLGEGDGNITPISFEPVHDVAVLQYTGGTTGRSKGAMLTHYNILANVLQSYEFFKHEIEMGKERCLTVIPLFHVFGMSSCMNLSIYTAAESIMLPRFELEEVLNTIKNEQPTMFPGVPTMYVAITSHPRAEEYNINSIRTCNSGSAPMPVELLRNFERKTVSKILEGYGLSEASPTTHCNPPFAERKPGSVGIGMPSTEYKIVDLATGTEEVPVGELGEVIIKGPQIMKGYWNLPEETAHTLREGWLYTGDIAKVDEDGYLYIVDRKKDLIIASGYNIYPRDIEEVLYEHPDVQEAVCIGVPDPYRGEDVKAVLVLKAGSTATEQEIIQYSKQNMAAYKVPRLVEFRDQLPKTGVGKILRRVLREEAMNK
ncbi:long-chain fatty acid--CoA ligase [Bacillus sp. AFS076308]|uniref:long-chain-fatty-acid--CoA ligase n=1 Tax=unclassified Bacillus (in: firmicutes) TaxID=185979 RepID=UPI000BF282A4|nr:MULTISPECIES: long-chain fatty acid--CoA ligase [unclassified Bacillus (in: firmicutes)]PFO04740.1 long-chain fatty acid--CoA ligase [Bacillus sp. AFS076308]PGV49818.1 long-chain fatty acid--CoA ligase [Bacillus sp. AFS037270]